MACWHKRFRHLWWKTKIKERLESKPHATPLGIAGEQLVAGAVGDADAHLAAAQAPGLEAGGALQHHPRALHAVEQRRLRRGVEAAAQLQAAARVQPQDGQRRPGVALE